MRQEYVIQGQYPGPHGWEDVCTETTRQEAHERLEEYRENDPGTPYRLVCRDIA